VHGLHRDRPQWDVPRPVRCASVGNGAQHPSTPSAGTRFLLTTWTRARHGGTPSMCQASGAAARAILAWFRPKEFRPHVGFASYACVSALAQAALGVGVCSPPRHVPPLIQQALLLPQPHVQSHPVAQRACATTPKPGGSEWWGAAGGFCIKLFVCLLLSLPQAAFAACV